MTWNYMAGDLYNLDDLIDFQRFYLQNLQKKEKALLRAESYQKYGLPGWRWTVLAMEAGIQIVIDSLVNIQKAIDENRNA